MFGSIGKQISQIANFLALGKKFSFLEKVRNQGGKGELILNDEPVKINDLEDLKKIAKEEENSEEGAKLSFKMEDFWGNEEEIKMSMFSEDATEDEIVRSIVIMQANNIEDEPSDDWINYAGGGGKIPSTDDSWDESFYPANRKNRSDPEGKKPNVSAIKQWVEFVKLANTSDEEIEEEYYRMRESPILQQYAEVDPEINNMIGKMKSSGRNPETTKKLLVDSIAYMVARKIWYVGRKPKHMTDHDWNEMTKELRPVEGSFDVKRTERWGAKFPYDEMYIYTSGKH